MPVTRALLERGRERYNIYCAPCHDRLDGGQGMVVQRGFRRPLSLHIDRLREAPIEHFYDVVSNGFGVMMDYAAQVTPAVFNPTQFFRSYLRAYLFWISLTLGCLAIIMLRHAVCLDAPRGGGKRYPVAA
jgi:hypothetical protein